MDRPENLDQFLEYIGEHPDHRPTAHILARAQQRETVPHPYTMPGGHLYVFPEFLVFLTTTTTKPGAGLMFKEFIDMEVSTFRTAATLHKWAAHPASLLIDVAKALATGNSARNEEALATALLNANSFFVPLEHIDAVDVGRHMAQTYLRLHTPGGSFIIHEDAAVESWLKGMRSVLGGTWEPELVAQLQAAVRRNQTRAVAPQPSAAPPAPMAPTETSASSTSSAPASHPHSASPALPLPASVQAPKRRRRSGCAAAVVALCLVALVGGGIALASAAARSHSYSSYGSSYSSYGSSSDSAEPTPTATYDDTFDPIFVTNPTPVPPTPTPVPPTWTVRLLSGQYNVTYRNQRAAAGSYFIWFDLSFTNNTAIRQSVSGRDLYLQDTPDHSWAMASFVDQGPFPVDPGYYLKDAQFAWVVPCSETKFRLRFNPDTSTDVYWDETTKGCA
ncbi:MAG TPA: hypothetical protein VF120_02640 [Ktedonobacterales bacterium]